MFQSRVPSLSQFSPYYEYEVWLNDNLLFLFDLYENRDCLNALCYETSLVILITGFMFI